jgi:molybdopterin converting factor small subunit
VNIRFFGKLGETIGRTVTIETAGDGCTVSELRKLLASLHPQAAADLARPSLRACVDDELVGEDFRLVVGGKVEFFPPLSGG